MDRARDYHTKWSKSYIERQISYDFHLYVEKNDTNELIYKTETDRQNKFRTTEGETGGEGIN